MKFFTNIFSTLFIKKASPPRLREKLTVMVKNFKYREVVNEYNEGKLDKKCQVSDIVGYCYYQLTEYEKAIFHLKLGLVYMPRDFYTNFFLAVSYKLLNSNFDAIHQFLKCLELEVTRENEVLDHILPLLLKINDFSERKKTLEVIKAILFKKFGPKHSYLPKIYFHTKQDHKLEEEILKDSKIYQLYSASELEKLDEIDYRDLGEPEKLRFIDINGNNPDILVDTIQPYVAEIQNATIVSGSSLIFFKDKILSDHLSNKKYGQFCCMTNDPTVLAQRDDALLIKNLTTEKEIAKGIMLCGMASDQYGHWTAEFLPKLRFYEQHPNFSELPIIIDETMPKSHFTFLKALTRNQIYILKKGDSLKVNTLLISPTDTFFPTNLKHDHLIPQEHLSSFTVGALQYLYKNIRRYYGEPQERPTDCIFLARKNSSWRKLINEEQIILELEKFNFKIINIEEFDFEEQVQIFQTAKLIVASNGSSLNNLVFSSPTVRTIMMGQENLFNWGGWFGSFSELGYNIEYLSGNAIGNNKNKNQDYEILPSVLIGRVKELLV